MPNIYKYHVVYMFSKIDGSNGFGTAFSTLNKKLTSEAIIRELQDSILDERRVNDSHDYNMILITAWTELDA